MFMANRQEVWLWNSGIVWHYHCSMTYEAFMARHANNDFMRYHHVRSCIYFSVTLIESFLNQQMRRHMDYSGEDEKNIIKTLRNTRIDKKLRRWPSIVCGSKVDLSRETYDLFSIYQSIRNEVTHPKRRDHSIYSELDTANPELLSDAISAAMVKVYEGMREPFPYWVLGWNYVGMNNNPAYPCELNNMNAFIWSLAAMGFHVPVGDAGWDKRNMMTLSDYEELKKMLEEYGGDIEPYSPRLPYRPRLTRRWWDHEFILNETKAAQEGGNMKISY